MARSNQLRVEIEGGVIHVTTKAALRARRRKSPNSCDKRERRGDDFVAGPTAEQQHRHVQRRGAAVEAGAIIRTTEFCEVLFKPGATSGPRQKEQLSNRFFFFSARWRHQFPCGCRRVARADQDRNFVGHCADENNPFAPFETILTFGAFMTEIAIRKVF